MTRAAALLFLVFAPSALFAADPPKTGPWDVAALGRAEVKPEWGKEIGKAREVYYPGEPYQGKPTRVFAYYARPAKGDGPFPAVALVHGGGGKAFREWAEHWAARGYCALAMDLAGNGPNGRLADGGPDQSDEAKFRAFDDKTVNDMWTYHAVAAVVRGHNLLRSFAEVDKDRIAVTGISWGGYLTCIVAGIDDRFKAAVPVYGCGFLHENSAWKEARFDKVDAGRRKRWVDTFDPSKYLPNVKCPILFLNGTNDFAYPMDSYQKCYELVNGPRTLSVRVRLPHGHIWTFGEVDAFIDTHLKKGDPLPTIGTMTRAGDTVSAKVSSKVKLKSAHLHYAVAEGPWQKRDWKSTDAEIKDGVVTAKLPADRPLVYELAVTDERGLEVTAPHAVLAADPRPVAPAPALARTAANVAYGTHERQVLDFWKAESKSPTPVVLLIHGGGWVNGDKSGYRNGVKRYLDAGISVVAINYRLVTQADAAGIKPPVKWPLEDAARALQFVRAKAPEWNLDKTRIGATGGSAGACSSLWLAFHNDRADPKSADPISRESTRLFCVAVNGAQTTLDPKVLREWMPNARYGGHAFGVRTPTNRDGAFQAFFEQREKLLPWIEEYSPITHVTKDDPPVFMEYPSQKKLPVKGENQDDPTHSALLGMILEEKHTTLVNFGVMTLPPTTYGVNSSFTCVHICAKKSPGNIRSRFQSVAGATLHERPSNWPGA